MAATTRTLDNLFYGRPLDDPLSEPSEGCYLDELDDRDLKSLLCFDSSDSSDSSDEETKEEVDDQHPEPNAPSVGPSFDLGAWLRAMFKYPCP